MNTISCDKTILPRVELHMHTRFSAFDALTDPDAVVARAAEWGMPAIAVTDHGTAQAFPDMWKAGKKHGVKIIYGIEAYYVPDVDGKSVRTVDSASIPQTYHMVLLVKNKAGLKNLYKLISASYLSHYHRAPTIPRSLLMQYRDGLLIGSACIMGELYQAVVAGAGEEELIRIASFYDYLELQPVSNYSYLVAHGKVSDVQTLQDFNRMILNLGHKLCKPVVATSDAHFLDAEDELYRKILNKAKGFSDSDLDCPVFFRSTKDMLSEFAYLGAEIAEEIVITNTRAIADQVEEIELLPGGRFLPKLENSAEDLKRLVYEKMHRIYGENPPEIVRSRVSIELSTILDHQYDVIYMTAQKLVQNSLENGYLVGSRGSVASSIVAYMSGITELNPLPPHYVCPKCHHSAFITDRSYGCGVDMPERDCPECGTRLLRDGFNIPHETFLGYPGIEKTPDIDLNFSGEYQTKAHKYTETLFGSDHVFLAGTVGTLSEKTAYAYVKKYFKEHGIRATREVINRLTRGLADVKCSTGQHPGGLVIIPQNMDVTDFCPVQHLIDDSDADMCTTHFEYYWMQENLLKFDELGHDDPTMIRMMEDMTGVRAKEISLSDPVTMSIFTSPAALGLPDDDPIIGTTGTFGIPDFERSHTRQILMDAHPTSFDDLIHVSGLSHGVGAWENNAQNLIYNGIANVNETIGSRDDIMLYLLSVGIEPELAYRTMEDVQKGKVLKSGKFPGNAEQQMRDKGVPEWYIESMRKIFYLFPKAHVAAYVMMAFRIAWFKVHEPLAFYAAYFYLHCKKGAFDSGVLESAEDLRARIADMKRRANLSFDEEELLATMEVAYEMNLRGVHFAPADPLRSDPKRFLITDDNRLLIPLNI